MQYGQGKDIQANYRAQTSKGKFGNALINMAGQTVGLLGTMAAGKAAGGLSNPANSELKESVIQQAQGIFNTGAAAVDQVARAKQESPNYTMPQQQPAPQQPQYLPQSNPAQPQLTQPMQTSYSTYMQTQQPAQPGLTTPVQPDIASQQIQQNKYDTGAGYNPKSGTFRSGDGQVTYNPRPTFEQQAAVQQPVQLNPNLTQSKTPPAPSLKFGNRLNYLNYLN